MTATTRPDIIVESPSGDQIAAIEVRNSRTLTVETATELRRLLLENALIPDSRYFLIVSQDVGYVWCRNARDDAPPALTFDMTEIVARFQRFREPGERIPARIFHWIVADWMNQLSADQVRDSTDAERNLRSIGLIDAVNGATVSASPFE